MKKHTYLAALIILMLTPSAAFCMLISYNKQASSQNKWSHEKNKGFTTIDKTAIDKEEIHKVLKLIEDKKLSLHEILAGKRNQKKIILHPFFPGLNMDPEKAGTINDTASLFIILLSQTDRAALQQTCKYFRDMASLNNMLEKTSQRYTKKADQITAWEKYFKTTTTEKQHNQLYSEEVFKQANADGHMETITFIASTSSGPWQMILNGDC